MTPNGFPTSYRRQFRDTTGRYYGRSGFQEPVRNPRSGGARIKPPPPTQTSPAPSHGRALRRAARFLLPRALGPFAAALTAYELLQLFNEWRAPDGTAGANDVEAPVNYTLVDTQSHTCIRSGGDWYYNPTINLPNGSCLNWYPYTNYANWPSTQNAWVYFVKGRYSAWRTGQWVKEWKRQYIDPDYPQYASPFVWSPPRHWPEQPQQLPELEVHPLPYYYPSVDPHVRPPGDPAPSPRPLPRRMVPRQRPAENPSRPERTERGDEAPQEQQKPRRGTVDLRGHRSRSPIEFELKPFPDGDGQRNRGARPRSRPGRRTKERKTIFNIHQRSLLGRSLNVITEGHDFVNCVYKGLPRKYRRAHTAQGRFMAVYRHFDKLDLGEVLGACLINQLEDMFFGTVGRAIGKASRRVGRPVGIATGPAL